MGCSLGTAMRAFLCLCSYGSDSMTHNSLFPVPYQLILSISLNETWGKCDSLSFLEMTDLQSEAQGSVCLVPCSRDQWAIAS